MKKLIRMLLIGLITIAMVACGGNSSGGGSSSGSKEIVIWVGEESAEFYQKVCDDYAAAQADFPYTITVKGMDTGAVAGTVTNDPSAAADIYTTAHDNIGKLASTQCAKPFTDEELIKQVLADNPASFQNVIYSTLEGQKYLYGVPYISQALFLYYNKEKVTEEQAATSCLRPAEHGHER